MVAFNLQKVMLYILLFVNCLKLYNKYACINMQTFLENRLLNALQHTVAVSFIILILLIRQLSFTNHSFLPWNES